MTETAIDVLLPIYNAVATLRETIQSLQAQTVSNFRILAIDDGSTDGSADLMQELADKDGRIQVFRKPNGGIVDALNYGIARLQAPMTARQDADDLSHPRRFAEQLDYMQANPGCIALSGCARHIDGRGRLIGSHAIMRPPEDSDAAAAPSREPYLMHPFLMVRREALQAVGGYRCAFHSEDTDLYWRLMERGRLHNLPFLVGDYRIHAASISSTSVLNGRIAAATSQLAGISHLRRKAGRVDLSFEPSRLETYKAAQTAAGICQEASLELDDDERTYFRIAFSSKLMELASYRPYCLDAEDYTFIRDQIDDALPRLRPSDADNVRFLYVRAQARLLRGLLLRQLAAFGRLSDLPKAAMLASLKKPGFMAPKAPDPPDRETICN